MIHLIRPSYFPSIYKIFANKDHVANIPCDTLADFLEGDRSYIEPAKGYTLEQVANLLNEDNYKIHTNKITLHAAIDS